MASINFEFATATKIAFGIGVLAEVGKYAVDLGKKAFVALGVENEHSEKLLSLLSKNKINSIYNLVRTEPTVEAIQEACKVAEENQCDIFIGFGGGSAIDTAKAVSILLANPDDIYDYLEVIGKGQPFINPAYPVVAIPTTAGTGAEVTRNAVVHSLTNPPFSLF